MKLRYVSCVLLGATLLIGTAAHAQDSYSTGIFSPAKTTKTFPCNNTQFLQDQQAFENGQITADQPEDVCGMVTAVLPAKKPRAAITVISTCRSLPASPSKSFPIWTR